MQRIMSLLLIVCLTSGCATYRAGRLPSMNLSSFQNVLNQDGLQVGVKFLDARESKQIFGVGKMHKLYQPIFIVVDNRTKSTYEFRKRMLNRGTISAEEVAKECGFSTVGRATGYGIAGLFIWPLLIPAVVDGVGSSNANQRMEDDYIYKEIKDERVVPNGLLNGVVFLDKMKDGEELVVRLQDVETNDIKLFRFIK